MKINKDDLKTYIFVATTAVGISMYMHSTFATKGELNNVISESKFSKKVLCLIAYRLRDSDLPPKQKDSYLSDEEFLRICRINLK